LEFGNFGFLENCIFLIAFDKHMKVCLLQVKTLFGLTKYHKNESSMNSSLKVYVCVLCLFLECLFIIDLFVAPLGFFPFVQVLLFLGTCNQQDTHLAMASPKSYSDSSVDMLRPCNLSKFPQCALCKNSPTNYQSRQRQIY